MPAAGIPHCEEDINKLGQESVTTKNCPVDRTRPDIPTGRDDPLEVSSAPRCRCTTYSAGCASIVQPIVALMQRQGSKNTHLRARTGAML